MKSLSNLENILNDPILGLCFAPITVAVYNRLTNRSPGFIFNQRVHHYQLGIILSILGILKKKKFLVGWGTGLIAHDFEDLCHDLNKSLILVLHP
jgi:hypothetical protein